MHKRQIIVTDCYWFARSQCRAAEEPLLLQRVLALQCYSTSSSCHRVGSLCCRLRTHVVFNAQPHVRKPIKLRLGGWAGKFNGRREQVVAIVIQPSLFRIMLQPSP